MAESAPDALKWLGSRVSPDLGGTLSGIVGDSAHTRGYHRGRAYVPSTDYSVKLTEDKKGSAYYACAIDMSFSASKMKLYTQRMRAAAENNDPRFKFVREFYGTLNGTDVFGRIHEGSGDGTWRYSTSDKSHLWHIHMSILREYSNNKAIMQGILDVLMGKPLTALVLGSRVLQVGMSGSDVTELQKLLVDWGATLTPDGTFGPATETAVKSFQSASKLTVDGIAGTDTITALKSATQEDDDMDATQAAQLAYVDARLEALANGRDTVRADLKGGGSPVWIVQAVKALATAVSSMDDEVAGKLRTDFDLINKSVEAVGQDVTGVDEAVIAQLQAKTPEETAALLRAALGDQADAVFRAGLAAEGFVA